MLRPSLTQSTHKHERKTQDFSCATSYDPSDWLHIRVSPWFFKAEKFLTISEVILTGFDGMSLCIP